MKTPLIITKQNLIVAFLLLSQSIFAQFDFSGKVKDERGNPLAGASVVINEKNLASTTDNLGNFKFNLSMKVFTVEVSFIGYKKYSKLIDLNQTQSIEIQLEKTAFVGDEIILTANRAKSKTPIAHINLDKKEIESRNLAQDLPILMELTPSYVSTSDGGTGVGYTNMRIRGADNTRINVTMNGIPVNDSESHGVWWVNMPDLASSIEDIQIQRGVGSSTNGAGAFGATINLRTNQLNSQAYAEANTSFGSFNTQKYNLKAGSGLIADRFTIDARGSIIKTDGYIDRAKADLKSIFLTSSYYGDNNSIIFNFINGKENTYQAWNGVPLSYLNDDDKRTFNSYTYENEVDDYNQIHYQLFYNHQFSDNFKVELASFLVRGQGFYEQYKGGEDLDDYGLTLKDADGNNLTSSDLIRQKWLDNYFYGTVYNFTYSHDNGDLILGGGWNKYDGDHFGKVLKVIDASPSTLNPNHEYYRNNADKEDFNIYLKMDQMIGKYVNLYADVQYRQIEYNFEGQDEFGNPVPGSDSHNFFLPKAGLSFLANDNNTLYFSYARGAREPNRTDYVDNPIKQEPKAEYLNDFEGGYKLQTGDFAMEVNLFYMHYKDQLIATGKLNDVGNAIRVNVEDSYRAGIEFAFGWRINEYVKWDGNLAYSKSNISKYTEYFDDWDNWTQIAVDYQNTAMAFSPEIISASNITVTPFENFNLGLITKYVGEQYIDNTQSNLRMLDDYLLNNIQIQYDFAFGPFKQVTVSALINNIFDVRYSSNAWVYKYKSGDGSYDGSYGDIYSTANGNAGFYDMAGYFSQAGTNFLLGLSLKL